MISELRIRTVARAVTYRMSALAVSLIMFGVDAAIIVELTKTAVYYLCERLWLRSNWELSSDGTETHKRTIARSLVYRAVATIAISYWVGWVSAIELAIIQTALYYMNERLWLKVHWGIKSIKTT